MINELYCRYPQLLYHGFIDGADKYNYNLITFVGKHIGSVSEIEDWENMIYKLASGKNVDGILIASGSIGNFADYNELKNFCFQFKPLPVLCLGTPIEGLPSMWIDNRVGMTSILTHFIEFHNYRKIAFIKGPVNSVEGDIRYQAYKDTMNKYRIPVSENLIVQGDYSLYSGINAVKELLDKRNAKFDAVIAANDEMLIGVYREFLKRGISIPADVALGGFDDIEETRSTTPQITTVSPKNSYHTGRDGCSGISG